MSNTVSEWLGKILNRLVDHTVYCGNPIALELQRVSKI